MIRAGACRSTCLAVFAATGVLLLSSPGWTSDPPLDLNTATQEELQRLPGIGPALAQRILADREANGPFRNPAEITRVFGIGELRYRQIQDRITVGPLETSREQAATLERINLNTAVQTELETLPGIGPILARRIIDYREREGGFRRVNDLQAVRGIGPRTFATLKNLVSVAPVSGPGSVPPPPSGTDTPASRQLKCWHCGRVFSVGEGVKSGKCPACGREWSSR